MSPTLLRGRGDDPSPGSGGPDEGTVDPRIQARRDQVAFEGRSRRRRRAVVVASLVGALALGWLLVHSSLLSVRHLEVTPSAHLSAAEITQAAGIGVGQHLIDVDEGTARSRLLRQPWVARARVSVGWNGTAHLSVTERTPVVAVAAGPSRWILADAHRRALGAVTALPPGVVVVSGIAAVAPGRTFGSGLDAPLAVMADLTPGLRTRIGAGGITVGSDGGLTLALQPGGVAQLCQPTDLAVKLSGLTTFFARVDDRGLAVVDACIPGAITVTRTAGA
jgi:cell division protein FtsQ